MKHLPREKQQQLALVALATAGVIAGLWFGLIRAQQSAIEKLRSETAAAESRLQTMRDDISRGARIQADLAAEAERLRQAESQMASGDLYAWIINTIRDFRSGHPGVDIPQFSTIVTGRTTLMPAFPYTQVKLTVGGTAFYHDLGGFVADFENRFPYMRFENLQIEPAAAGANRDAEKLAFRLDVVALVGPES